ncbi:hypothetical protein J6590_036563 [Homalodisca vitripennis]|nr:hypothetical protein J6590_036563 [Homalodisca vitripennis]
MFMFTKRHTSIGMGISPYQSFNTEMAEWHVHHGNEEFALSVIQHRDGWLACSRFRLTNHPTRRWLTSMFQFIKRHASTRTGFRLTNRPTRRWLTSMFQFIKRHASMGMRRFRLTNHPTRKWLISMFQFIKRHASTRIRSLPCQSDNSEKAGRFTFSKRHASMRKEEFALSISQHNQSDTKEYLILTQSIMMGRKASDLEAKCFIPKNLRLLSASVVADSENFTRLLVRSRSLGKNQTKEATTSKCV